MSATANPIIAAVFAFTACSDHTSDAPVDPAQSNDLQNRGDPLNRNPAATPAVIPAAADPAGAPVILAQATQPIAPPVPQTRTAAGGRPNILFIMGDDIGWMQPSI
jgi:hypothetical protein